MKYLARILVLLCVTSMFTACSKDDGVDSPMVGKWSVVEITCDDGVTSTTFDGITTTATFDFYGKDITSNVEFKDDNTFTSTGTYTQVLTTTFEGVSTETEITIPGFATGGTWEVDGNTITFMNTGQAEEGSAELIDVTDDNLEMKVVLNQVQVIPGGGSTSQTGNVYYKLTRQ